MGQATCPYTATNNVKNMPKKLLTFIIGISTKTLEIKAWQEYEFKFSCLLIAITNGANIRMSCGFLPKKQVSDWLTYLVY